MNLAELLELLARWNELTDDERGSLNEALGDLTGFTPDELTQLSEALSATADAILDDGPDDAGLEALTWIAETAEALRAEVTARADADADRATRAQELADRIRGSADDDGEPGDEATDTDAEGGADEDGGDAEAEGDDDGTESEDEPAGSTREPVAAAASPRVTRVNARRPGAVAPRARRSTAPLVAAAGVPNVSMGARLDDPEQLARAFESTVRAMAGMAMRPGMKVPVAHAEIEWPDDGYLDGNRRGNARKIAAATSPQAITAAGGICAAPTPRYDLPSLSVTDRPVRAGLTRFGADRGGVIIPGALLLSDLDGAATFWTVEDDIDAVTDPEVRKPCLRVDCTDDATVDLYAVVQCLEFGNFDARTWPERIARITQLAEAMTARQAESRMLTRIGALSTAVTVPQNLGTTRDILSALDLATAGLRNRHRMSPTEPLRWMAPAWLRNQMRSDLTREMPGSADERLAQADAEIEAFFTVRSVNVSWFLDGEAGQVFGAQADGPLLGWIPNVVSYLFPEGTWLLLDGGELNLGLTRDSDLNSRNGFQMFTEFFENVAFNGIESHRLTMSLCPTGAAAGTVEPVCVDVATS